MTMSPLDARTTKPLEGGASFSLGNRLLRIVWQFSWFLLARFTPPPLHGWRRTVLRAFGAKIGRGARVHASVNIWLPANLELGARRRSSCSSATRPRRSSSSAGNRR